jgi:hypothetical protein
MRKLTLLFLLLFPIFLFSQQLHYGSGGTVYDSKNQKVSPEAVRTLLSKNTKALTLYNSGRDKKTWGNVLFYSGLGFVATNVVVAVFDPKISSSPNPSEVKSERAKPTLAIIGGVLVAISIPIKIGYPAKIKAAIAQHNKGLAEKFKPTPSLSLVASSQQIGFKVEF